MNIIEYIILYKHITVSDAVSPHLSQSYCLHSHCCCQSHLIQVDQSTVAQCCKLQLAWPQSDQKIITVLTGVQLGRERALTPLKESPPPQFGIVPKLLLVVMYSAHVYHHRHFNIYYILIA